LQHQSGSMLSSPTVKRGTTGPCILILVYALTPNEVVIVLAFVNLKVQVS
jgi:hypothetical protein